jgi:hypothetical protein
MKVNLKEQEMPRAKSKFHYVYKITCTTTGRYYIGVHSTSNMDDRIYAALEKD